MKSLLKILILLGLGAALLAIVPITRDRVERLEPPRLVGSVGAGIESHNPATTEVGMKRPDGASWIVVVGRVSATEERALADARRKLEAEVRSWLDPQVPLSWRPPGHLVDELVREARTTPEIKDYGTVYTATLSVDLSLPRRERFLEAYREEVVASRLMKLGGGFAFILACLGAASGYIRADEATKGYYTNTLRVVAAAGVGASGFILYRMLA